MSEIFLINGWNMPNSIWTELERQWSHATDAPVKFTIATLPGYEQSNCDLLEMLESNQEDHDDAIESILSMHLEHLLKQAPRSAHWCGWSLGATLALAAATRFPDRIARLTLISPTPRFLLSDDWAWGMQAVHFDKLKRVIDRDFLKGWQRFFQLQLPRDSDPDVSLTLMHKVRAGFSPPSAVALEQGKRLLCELDLRGELSQIKIPTQVIAANRDQIVPTEASRFVGQCIPDATYCQLKEGHGIPYLYPQELATVLAELEDRTDG